MHNVIVAPCVVVPFRVEKTGAFQGAAARVAGVLPPTYPLVMDAVQPVFVSAALCAVFTRAPQFVNMSHSCSFRFVTNFSPYTASKRAALLSFSSRVYFAIS